MKLVLLTLLFCSLNSVFGTGPSSILALINPVAQNNNGAVLCKTKLSKNGMGAYSEMDIYYGYCVITTDTILEFGYDTVFGNYKIDWEEYKKQAIMNDWEFKKGLEFSQLNWLEKELVSRYNFNSTDLNKREQIVSIFKIEPKLVSTVQRTLNSSRSLEYESDSLVLMVETEKFLFIKNVTGDEDSVSYGASFDFENYITVADGTTENIGFDIFQVTGVLNKKEE